MALPGRCCLSPLRSRPRLLPPQNLEKPDDEEVERTAAETAAALALRVDKKQAAVNPKTLPAQPGAAQFIKYTPADGGAAAGGSGAASRVIKMQDMPVDPLEPPKFRHVKARAVGAGRCGCWRVLAGVLVLGSGRCWLLAGCL